jgi:hypothetical protein
MIKPTIGRVVWFYDKNRQGDISQPLDAHIVYVHTDVLINIAGFDQNGVPFAQSSVFLRPDENTPVAGHPFWCEWMPYQVGQAKKHETGTAPTT